jgi:hypothetical protein
VVRLLAIANAALWVLGMPEMLDVWGDAYTIPSQLDLPSVTIWIVAGVLVATAVLVVVGFVRRQRATVTPWVRIADWVVGGLQLAWAGLYVWSFVLFYQELTAPNTDHNVAVQALYFEPLLALLSILSAVVLFRDARAVAPPPARVAARRVPAVGSAVMRSVLAAYLAVLLVYSPVYLAGWNHQLAQHAPGPANVPWGPFFVMVVCALSLGLLVLGWWWRRRGAPTTGRVWLRVGAGLQALWCVLLVWGYIADPIGLTREIAFDATQRGSELFALYGAFGMAVLAGLVAWVHDRDARRLAPVSAEPRPEFAVA